jgi:hypothetical protein
MFWLACAAVGFLAAVGAAVVLCVAVDGPDAVRASGKQLAERAHAKPSPNQTTLLAPALSVR